VTVEVESGAMWRLEAVQPVRDEVTQRDVLTLMIRGEGKLFAVTVSAEIEMTNGNVLFALQAALGCVCQHMRLDPGLFLKQYVPVPQGGAGTPEKLDG
jgi:hypothetical protein